MSTPFCANVTTLANASRISPPEGSISAYGLIHTYPMFFLSFFNNENRSDRRLDKKCVCAVGRVCVGVFLKIDAAGFGSEDGDEGFELV